MSKPEHSPLPWKYGDACDLLDAHGNVIAMMDESDARLIIATLESHSALLAASKLGARRLRNITYDERFWGDIEAAVAKAEGKSE